MLRAMDKWLIPYLCRRKPEHAATTHAIICVCDHFEPLHNTDHAGAMRRLDQWHKRFPELSRTFEEATGSPLKWSFFYPIEQYDKAIVGSLATLCRNGFGETEIHLHHDNDSAESLAAALEHGKANLTEHGLLSRDEHDAIRFGFVHGNWALDNSRPDGSKCGVNNELQVLLDHGCYGDFTMPSAPDPTQTRTVNSIYYARPGTAPKSHDTGIAATVGQAPEPDRLLLVQGPLALNWKRRKFGLLPRLENADLTQANPPTDARFQLWLDQRIQVLSRPEWLFIKLHTHGAYPENIELLFGKAMTAFASSLKKRLEVDKNLHIHFVTARELVNIIHAAERGECGNPSKYRNVGLKSTLS